MTDDSPERRESNERPATDRRRVEAQARDGVAWRGLLRALRLRCPLCGVGRLVRSWLWLREACTECGLRFERDEREDYWLGAYTLNFIVTELVFALMLAVVLVATWPDPPWTAIIWIGVIQMCLTPILFYPFAKALWLAIDLVFRPAQPEDFGARRSEATSDRGATTVPTPASEEWRTRGGTER